MKTLKVKRTIVAEILDKVRQDLAARVPPEEIERKLDRANGYAVDGKEVQTHGAYGIYGAPSIPPLARCHHEAGIFADNCLSCAPRWEWTGVKVVCS